MKEWFKRNKQLLTVLAIMVGGPTAGIYIQATDAAIEASEVIAEPAPAPELPAQPEKPEDAAGI